MNRQNQFQWIDGFDEVHLESAREGRNTILRARVRRQCSRRRPTRGSIQLTYCSHELETVHTRHADVAEYRVDCAFVEQLERSGS